MIDSNAMESILELFVVMYLKSSDAVKIILFEDLLTVFDFIRQAETRIFVDREFKYKIWFHGLF